MTPDGVRKKEEKETETIERDESRKEREEARLRNSQPWSRRGRSGDAREAEKRRVAVLARLALVPMGLGQVPAT